VIGQDYQPLSEACRQNDCELTLGRDNPKRKVPSAARATRPALVKNNSRTPRSVQEEYRALTRTWLEGTAEIDRAARARPVRSAIIWRRSSADRPSRPSTGWRPIAPSIQKSSTTSAVATCRHTSRSSNNAEEQAAHTRICATTRWRSSQWWNSLPRTRALTGRSKLIGEAERGR
jgi:hypothetical protein